MTFGGIAREITWIRSPVPRPSTLLSTCDASGNAAVNALADSPVPGPRTFTRINPVATAAIPVTMYNPTVFPPTRPNESWLAMLRTPTMIDDTMSGTTTIFSAFRNRPPKKSRMSTTRIVNSVLVSLASAATKAASASAMAICQCSGMPTIRLQALVFSVSLIFLPP